MIVKIQNTKTLPSWLNPSQLVLAKTPQERAWRGCVLATAREYRRSIRKGKPISLPNLERYLLRRWHDACQSI